MTTGFSLTTAANVTQSEGTESPVVDARRQFDFMQLESVVAECGARDGLDQIAAVFSKVVEVYSIVWAPVDGSGNQTEAGRFSHQLPLAEEGLENLLKSAVKRCLELEPSFCSPAQFEREISRADTRARGDTALHPCLIVAVQVRYPGGESGVLAAAVERQSRSPEYITLLFNAVARCLTSISLDGLLLESRKETGATAAVIDLALQIEACSGQTEACQLLVDESRRHTGADVVVIGLIAKQGRLCHLEAIAADSAQIDDPKRDYLEAALNEVLLRESLTLYPPEKPTERHGLLAVKRLVEVFVGGGLIAAPIHDARGIPIAVWLYLAGSDDVLSDPANTRFVQAASLRVGPALDLVHRAERPAWRQMLERHFASAKRSRTRTAATGALLVAALLVMPLPFRVGCQCELQPVVRQFVASPFDGSLEECFVEPGQEVKAGDMLARMDDREITWEMAGIDAERQQASTERDSHLVKQDIAAAEMSRYDLDRLALRQRLLKHRSEVLEIRSPIDGVVVSGDLKKSEGRPLASGDQLFEIAPLDRILVEVNIAESEVRHVAVGQPVEVWLNAFPGDSWEGQLLRIHPRSEIREQEHVFVAEVELQNDDRLFRPGMRGTARISAGLEPAGWILLHRPWEAFLMKTGW